MGGSVSRSFSTRKFHISPAMIEYMPSYFQPSISKSDIQRCKEHWDTIHNELILPSNDSEGIGEIFDSKKAWLYSLLSHGITETILAESSFRTHPFLSKMLEIINLSFSQWNHDAEFHRQTLLLTKECCNYGIKYQNFIDFGPILFSSLLTVSQSTNDSLDKAWKCLYSSILVVIIPYCLHSGEVVTIPAEGGVDPPIPPAVAESKPMPHDTAPQTSPNRLVISAASSKLRMNTSISNTVPL